MVQRRQFLKAVSLGVAGAVVPSLPQRALASVPGTVKPNILIIVSDEHQAGLTKRSGYPLDTSPTLDRLAEQGTAFDRAYCTAPLCVPSRVSLLTGRWPQTHRVRQNSQPQVAFFEQDIFDVAKSLGYKTGLAGKNDTHLKREKLDFWREYGHMSGWKPDNAPQELLEYEQWLERLNLHGVSPTPTPFPVEAQFPYRIVSNAIEFMEEVGGQPFALEVSFPEPHNPIQVPTPYFDMYPPDQVPGRLVGPEALKAKGFKWQWLRGLEEDTYPGYDKDWRRYKSNYLGMLRLLDDQLARLVAYLKEKRLIENTIIVYVADHGDYLMEFGLEGKGVGMPEALVRIPMVWSGWGIQPGPLHHPAFVSNADVMPTLCEAMGTDIPHGVEGRSLWPLLQGKDYPEDEFRSIYAETGFGGLYYDATDNVDYGIAEFYQRGPQPHPVPGQQKTYDSLNYVDQSGYMEMLRMGDWKLYYDMMGYGQLYHLPSDPSELKNRFGDPAVKSEELRMVEELLSWTIRTQDSLPTGTYKTKWPNNHNWYTPYRHGKTPGALVP